MSARDDSTIFSNMEMFDMRTTSSSSEQYWERLYWFTRTAITLLWIWTAYVSWFVFPHSESLQLLRELGITRHENAVFTAACLLDAGMGIASALFATRMLWLTQICLVSTYSVAIAIWLPEFMFHPFGPITKNFAVLACLAYLLGMEKKNKTCVPKTLPQSV